MTDIALRKIGETTRTITFAYDKIEGAEGYRYFRDGVPVSRTFDPDDLEVRFEKGSAVYRVAPLDVEERVDGFVWPPPPTDNVLWREDFASAPASWWNWAYGNNNGVGFPNPGASIVGGALNLGSPPNAPGGAGILASMWTFDHAHGRRGEKTRVVTRFSFDADFAGWFQEEHENFEGSRDIYSNAIGITSARKLLVQRTGGELSSHPSANGWQTVDSQVLEPGREYELVREAHWSPGADGFYRVFLDGRKLNVNRENGPTLLTEGGRVDQVAFGLYSYPYEPEEGPTWMRFNSVELSAL